MAEDEIPNQAMINPNNKPIPKKKSRKYRILKGLGITAAVFVAVFLILSYMGYLPFFFRAPIEPIGHTSKIDIDSIIDDISEIGNIPNLDKIDKTAYESDATIEDIVDDYKQKHLYEGYSLEYENTVEIEGKTFHVLGFLKGLTAAGVLISDELNENNDSSEVIYVTGNALDFMEIIEWYQNK